MRYVLTAVLIFLSAVPAWAEKTTLTQITSIGKPVVCSFEWRDRSAEQKGTVYVARERSRADYEVKTRSGTVPVHMVRDTEWTWSWGGEIPSGQGLKMRRYEAVAKQNKDGLKYFDMDKTMDFKCQDWSVETKKFDLPADVNFAAQEENAVEKLYASPRMKAMQCESCNSAENKKARAECRRKLGCEE
jgi:hypothetical protein